MTRGAVRVLYVGLFALLLVTPVNFSLFAPRVQNYSVAASAASYEMLQYHLPNGSSQPFAIATDNLGREWIAEQGSNQLGMFDPSTRAFQEYAFPTPDSMLSAVAIDSSDNVWVVGLTSNKLGELKNGTNIIIEFSIPNGSTTYGNTVEPLACGPVGVFVGPHQDVWILCDFSNQIDEFFPQNSTFSSFNLPEWQSGPVDLVFDQQGNFWFTAADADMLGRVVISQLRNGTTDGISEFTPRNETYTFVFDHSTDLAGDRKNITSSLPTPAGIALSPDGKSLWITEHADGAFDSYNIATKSLDRFWTSKTYDAFGYPYSFPNGIAVDANGIVWMAEHYGNKVAEYNPSTGKLTEYAVPCCGVTSSGLYTLTLGKDGTVWFVEIFGNAIGELKPASSTQSFEINTPRTFSVSTQPAILTIPIYIQYTEYPSDQPVNVSLDIAGISKTGALAGALAQFTPTTFQISGSGNMTSNLNLSIDSLDSGIYDFTVSANLSSSGITYSTVFAVSVGATTSFARLVPYALAAVIIASFIAVGALSLRMKTKKSP
ncbi:MAG: SMP-30/gluconolactonase/LRE family protein [Nitrososphaerota archaeon]|nr:SMP-30/gluconolactonase/LRE family protein [Nitrososphaerota archaeon]